MNSPRFNLEERIAHWRKQMTDAGIKSPEPIGELENHLREDIQRLMAAGESEATAFRIASARVGLPGVVTAEFEKNGFGGPRILKPALIIWGGMVAVLVVAMMMNYGTAGTIGLLLAGHVVILTGGYLAAFVAGVAGIVGLCGRRYAIGLMEHDVQLRRTIRFFTRLATGLVVAGLVVGVVWWRQQNFILSGIDIRVFANVCVAVWLVFVSILQWRIRMSGRVEIQLSIVGNIVIGIAWFGVGAMVQGYNIFNYWPMDILLGAHLFLLGLSMRHGSNLLEA